MANVDLLKSCNFRMLLGSNRSFEFAIQEANLPGFSIGQIDIPRFNLSDKRPGDHIEYNDLNLTVLCDEDMKAYREVYEAIELSSNPRTGVLEVTNNIFEGQLYITSNKNNPKFMVVYHNAWIKSVDDLTFTTTDSEDIQMTFPVTIAYTHFTFKDINNG